jgi:hypothetical protein
LNPMNCPFTKIIDPPGNGPGERRLAGELDQDVVKLPSEVILKSQLANGWNRILMECRSDLIRVFALDPQVRIYFCLER